MDFIWGVLKVGIGGFALFTIARLAFARMVPRIGWAWVGVVGALALASMGLHKWLGSTINPPFYTAVLFGTTLLGLAPDDTVVEGAPTGDSRWLRRGAIAVAVGTLLGWIFYVDAS